VRSVPGLYNEDSAERSEKLVAENGDNSENQRKGNVSR
jgi:hypothetical protein